MYSKTTVLPSGEIRKILSTCRAVIGSVGNADHQNISQGKAAAPPTREEALRAREEMAEDPAGTLRAVAEMGYEVPDTVALQQAAEAWRAAHGIPPAGGDTRRETGTSRPIAIGGL